MRTEFRFPSGLMMALTMVTVAGCGGLANEASDSGAAAAPTGADPDAGTGYTLVFTGAEPTGTWVVNFTNLAFTIDRQNATRELAMPGVHYATGPGFVKSGDLVNCETRSPVALESAVGSLARGDAAHVDYLDLEALEPPALPGAPAKPAWSGGVCFGYREPGGAWRWSFDQSPFTRDASTNRWRAHVPIARGPLDAIKVVFSENVPHLLLTRITYVAQPPSAAGSP